MRTVAIMGGHDIARGTPSYKRTVHLAYQLSRLGYLIATGGGPGLMEAANLGAYLSGFAHGVDKIDAVVALLSKAPVYDHKDWLEIGFRAKLLLGEPDDFALSKNVGIPTWFYGHEPPNVFATHVAKYFENSAREEGLLAVAWAGVIFARGNGGTVQEIFQDANQNYYKIFGKLQSPMVLLESQYWNPVPGVAPIEKAKPVYPLLLALAKEKDFENKILLTDSSEEIVAFISRHSPVQGSTGRWPQAAVPA
jgi:predicted Rossmann-fold nucleotide-binding protein